MDYQEKYMKYKIKYLELKNSLGSGKIYYGDDIKKLGVENSEGLIIFLHSETIEILKKLHEKNFYLGKELEKAFSKRIDEYNNYVKLRPSPHKFDSLKDDILGYVKKKEEAMKTLSSSQLKTYGKLKTEPYYKTHLSGDSKSGHLKNFFDLVNAGLKSEVAYLGAYNLTGDINNGQIKKFLELMKAGGNHAEAIEKAKL